MSKKPTAEEICRTIELMSMYADEDDSEIGKLYTFLYKITHCREGNHPFEDVCKNPHEDWIQEFRNHQEYWGNLNKAPGDKSKRKDLEEPPII